MIFPAFCTFKPTGRLVVVPDGQSFSSNCHEYVRPTIEKNVVAPVEAQAPEVVAPTSETLTDEERFEFLKSERAYLVSKPVEVREEYNALKLKLGR